MANYRVSVHAKVSGLVKEVASYGPHRRTTHVRRVFMDAQVPLNVSGDTPMQAWGRVEADIKSWAEQHHPEATELNIDLDNYHIQEVCKCGRPL